MDRTTGHDVPVWDQPIPPPPNQPGPGVEAVLKAALAVPTLLLIVSFGGQMFLPVLIPAHVWAANRSGPIGRPLWAVPSAMAAAMFGWLLTYQLVGEVQPLIWLAPLLAAIVGLKVFLRFTAYRRSHRPESGRTLPRPLRELANRSTRSAASLAAALSVLNFGFIQSIGILLMPIVWFLVGAVILLERARPKAARDRVALTLAGISLACPWIPIALFALAVRLTS